MSFMSKHYNFSNTIPQANKFVVFDGFFNDRPNENSSGPKRARIYMGKLQHIWFHDKPASNIPTYSLSQVFFVCHFYY